VGYMERVIQNGKEKAARVVSYAVLGGEFKMNSTTPVPFSLPTEYRLKGGPREGEIIPNRGSTIYVRAWDWDTSTFRTGTYKCESDEIATWEGWIN